MTTATQKIQKGVEYSEKYDNVVKCKLISQYVNRDGELIYKVHSYSKYGDYGVKHKYAYMFFDFHVILS